MAFLTLLGAFHRFLSISCRSPAEDLGAVSKSRSGRFETQFGQEMQGGISMESRCRNLNHYRGHILFPKLV